MVKNKDPQVTHVAQAEETLNPFSQAKSIVVSWESLRSQSLAHLQKNSE